MLHHSRFGSGPLQWGRSPRAADDPVSIQITGGVRDSFNGAAARGLRMMAMPSVWEPPATVLQWGRSPRAADDCGERRAGRRLDKTFNGAAARGLRMIHRY